MNTENERFAIVYSPLKDASNTQVTCNNFVVLCLGLLVSTGNVLLVQVLFAETTTVKTTEAAASVASNVGLVTALK